MAKTLRVEVTQEDIDNGEKRSSGRCPLALAIRRHPGMRNAAVGTTIWGRDHKDWPLPVEAQVFIYAFDCGHSVSPQVFELPLTTRRVEA